MRKVKFKAPVYFWITPDGMKYEGSSPKNRKDKYVQTMSDYIFDGLFHGWGIGYENDGKKQTMAIIELSDGRVEFIYPHCLIFVS